MDTLTLVRHGDYNSRNYSMGMYGERHLTPKGQRQIDTLGRDLADHLAGETVLLSSPAARATDTARILAKHLGLEEFTVHEALLCQGDRMPTGRNDRFYDLVTAAGKAADNVVVAGHYAVARHFPRYLASKENWLKLPRVPEPEKGQAVHLDLKARTWQMLPDARHIGGRR